MGTGELCICCMAFMVTCKATIWRRQNGSSVSKSTQNNFSYLQMGNILISFFINYALMIVNEIEYIFDTGL